MASLGHNELMICQHSFKYWPGGQATNHNRKWWILRYVTTYGVTCPWWVNGLTAMSFSSQNYFHDDITKWKHFPRYWLFVSGFHRSGEFHSQRPATQSFDVFFDLRLNKRFSKQSWGWWFETPSHSLWRHCNIFGRYNKSTIYQNECFMKSAFRTQHATKEWYSHVQRIFVHLK